MTPEQPIKSEITEPVLSRREQMIQELRNKNYGKYPKDWLKLILGILLLIIAYIVIYFNWYDIIYIFISLVIVMIGISYIIKFIKNL